MTENKRELVVVINGTPMVLSANINSPLRSIVGKALEQSGNAGQPPESWELRDAAGALLDLDMKIKDFNFPADVKLFLNLKAGVGGAAWK